MADASHVNVSAVVDKKATTITQTTTIEDGMGNIIDVIHTRVLHLEDEVVRKALIAMGWTPPPEKEKDA